MSFELEKAFEQIPYDAFGLLEQLENYGGVKAYFVGGLVRDTLLGRKPHDIDIVVDTRDATKRQTEQLENTLFGWGLNKVETSRGTVYTRNDSYPLEVTLTDNLSENLLHRDLTINAIAIGRDLMVQSAPLALQDLEHRRFRTPYGILTLTRDPYRFIRYARFAADYPEFEFVPSLRELLLESEWRYFPAGRDDHMGQEIMKLLRSRDPARALRLLAGWNLLAVPFPGLVDLQFPQDPTYHDFDVQEHTLRVLEHLRKEPLHLILAGLYHDAGKPKKATREGNRIHFYSHEPESSKIAEEDLTRLGLSSQLIEKVTCLVREHMAITSASSRAVRRLMGRLKEHDVDPRDLVRLRTADIKGQRINWPQAWVAQQDLLNEFMQAVISIEQQQDALTVKDLAITGDEIMELLGIAPSPYVGKVKNELLELVLDDPKLNTREKLGKLVLEVWSRIQGNANLPKS